jgi:hypothetical protein
VRDADEQPQPFYIAAHDSLVDEPPRTLKHGDTFALFDHYGDLASRRGNTWACITRTRVPFALKLTVEQRSPLLLCSTVHANNAMLDVDLTNPDVKHGDALLLAKDTVHFTRTKFLWNGGCYETLSSAISAPKRCAARGPRLRCRLRRSVRDPWLPARARGKVNAQRARQRCGALHLRLPGRVARVTDIFFTPAPRELASRHAGFELDLPPRCIAPSSCRALLGRRRLDAAARVSRHARRTARAAHRHATRCLRGNIQRAHQ